MDRRQRKTRDAIFQSFIALLAEKDFNKITVGEIIDLANVGRATFYAHFETKDFLLKELCEELFEHIFESATGITIAHAHLFDCDASGSVFLHLLQHVKNNDNHILELLSSRNDDLFLGYFKENVKTLVQVFDIQKPKPLPEDFWLNHISATFVETVKWWIDHRMQQSPEEIAEYFMLAIQ